MHENACTCTHIPVHTLTHKHMHVHTLTSMQTLVKDSTLQLKCMHMTEDKAMNIIIILIIIIIMSIFLERLSM